ncbi:MAG: TdeIII family type II restriction endonuclease [Methanobacteriota archaeon]|nr:MAG: TdeIII family type II restriction endonuclease [Euryarchaeota archaeon]
MALSNTCIERIAHEVVATLVARFATFPEDASGNRNAPFHEAFLKAFANELEGKVSDIPLFISLSSWLHGLNTTLGQSFFEQVAHIISDGEKREYTSKKLGNLMITPRQKQVINQIITDLSVEDRYPNVEEENGLLFYPHPKEEETVSAIDFSADVFYTVDDKIVAIELKTVKPNSGEMRGEKRKILEGKAALYNKFVNGQSESTQILFYIGFPFDPTSDTPTGFDKSRFFGNIINLSKYFDPNESLIASELWDSLAGESGTMQQILDIINAIATPEFMDRYKFVQDGKNRLIDRERFREILQDWFLFSEIIFLDNEELILTRLPNMKKKFNQLLFNKDGKYQWKRHVDLLKALNTSAG